ncbi:GUN4 domain protein [Nostoc linckia NIES-25]|nr:GUN4 domain protein [Nostoc linckia NIES-25]
MKENTNRPRVYDAVLGGQEKAPPGAVVLGGLEGVKRRLANPVIEQRIAALEEALKYGEAGLELVIWALDDKLWKVRQVAYSLLASRQEPIVQEILQDYSHKIDRYDAFVAMARAGGVSDIDTLMENLENDRTSATYKLYHVRLISYDSHTDCTPPRQSCALSPLPACGEGIKGWGSSGLTSNQADMILVDFTLGLVDTPQGQDRIRHYLFNGTQIQRNYAALYFKRRGAKNILKEAVNQGCIDKLQAFSK